LSWTKNTGNNNVIACLQYNKHLWNTGEWDFLQFRLDDHCGGTVIYNGPNSSFNHTLLTLNTTYYYKLWSLIPPASTPRVQPQAQLPSVALFTTFPWVEGFEHSGIAPACWSETFESGSQSWAYQNGGYTGGSHPSAAHSGSYNACLYVGNYTHPVTKTCKPTINITVLQRRSYAFGITQGILVAGSGSVESILPEYSYCHLDTSYSYSLKHKKLEV